MNFVSTRATALPGDRYETSGRWCRFCSRSCSCNSTTGADFFVVEANPWSSPWADVLDRMRESMREKVRELVDEMRCFPDHRLRTLGGSTPVAARWFDCHRLHSEPANDAAAPPVQPRIARQQCPTSLVQRRQLKRRAFVQSLRWA